MKLHQKKLRNFIRIISPAGSKGTNTYASIQLLPKRTQTLPESRNKQTGTPLLYSLRRFSHPSALSPCPPYKRFTRYSSRMTVVRKASSRKVGTKSMPHLNSSANHRNTKRLCYVHLFLRYFPNQRPIKTWLQSLHHTQSFSSYSLNTFPDTGGPKKKLQSRRIMQNLFLNKRKASTRYARKLQMLEYLILPRMIGKRTPPTRTYFTADDH